MKSMFSRKSALFAFWAPRSSEFNEDYKGLAHGGAAKIFCRRRVFFCCKIFLIMEIIFCNRIMELRKFAKNFIPGSRP